MLKLQRNLVEHFLKPQNAWGVGRPARKEEIGVAALAKHLGLSKREAVWEALAIGRTRQKLARKTIYVSNIGSSGSHWLQAIISELNPVLACGEVYLAKPMTAWLKLCDPEERDATLQALYFLHSCRKDFTITADTYLAPAINTAHVANLQNAYGARPETSVRVLLIRNPVDVAISRTLRKQEFKKYLGLDGMSDEEYLLTNIEKLRGYYKHIDPDQFDVVCSYEALRAGGTEDVRKIVELVWGSCDTERLRTVIDCLSYENMRQGDVAGTNVFKGEEPIVDDNLRTKAQSQLDDVMKKFGYL